MLSLLLGLALQVPPAPGAIPVRYVCDAPALDCYLTLMAASAILDIPIAVDNRRDGEGQITIFASPSREGAHILGFAAVTEGCRRAVFAELDPQVIAHELGHALGLDHTPSDQTNLMFPTDAGGIELTPEQRRVIQREVFELRTGLCLVA